MIRGGSAYFHKFPRWFTVVMQQFIVTPIVFVYNLPLYTIPVYCLGWYLTIARGYGDIFSCKTWKQRGLFFLRMCHSAALFVSLAFIKDPHWYSLFLAAQYTVCFAAVVVLIYTLYNKEKGHTDASFNWSEFATYALLAAMTFNLLTGN